MKLVAHCLFIQSLLFTWQLKAFDFVPLFSYALPGVTEVYEGEWVQGLATTSVYLGTRNYHDGLKEEVSTRIYVIETEGVSNLTNVPSYKALELDLSAAAIVQLQSVSSYNAYRLRGGHDESYSDILIAPFNPSELFKPTSVVSLLIAGTLLARSNTTYKYEWNEDISRASINGYVFGRMAYGPAVSEEMFYRGYLNTELSKKYSPFIGVPLTALIFGAAHKGTGLQANSLMAGLAGLGLGALQVSNDYRISQGVALHFWLNFLAGLKAIENGGSAPSLVSFQMQF